MTHLKPGDQAPEFKAVDHLGKPVSLESYRGKKLILYFYPKDNTPGCNAEACNLRDNYELMLGQGFQILGVSADSAKAHAKFQAKFDLPFPLIPDTEKELIGAYGIWGPKKFMGKTYDGIHRTTFVIDENGVIEEVIVKVKTKDHANQIFELMNLK